MKTFNFRPLTADEVDVRPAEAKDGRKATLLLYQDARCAMNILDSTLGPTAWQREYYEAAGLLFCKIGIYDSESNQWLWKSDTGSKSNIEEDKGLASDAFKRAAVAWGIGRELYTAPRIIIDLTDKDLFNGRLCQSFHVGRMEVKDGIITALTILDKWNNTRFTYSIDKQESPKQGATTTENTPTPLSNSEKVRAFCSMMKTKEGVDTYQLKKFYNFYTGPSKTDPSKSIADSFKSFDPQARWVKWISHSTNKAA